MKNRFFNLKNALISAGIAVFAGVLMLGVNAAIGEAPTYQPPGNAVVPTVSGLKVSNGENVWEILTDTMPDDPEIPILKMLGRIVFDDNVFIDKRLVVKDNAVFQKDLDVGTGTISGRDLNVTGKISNGGNGAVPVQIDDILRVTGDTTINGLLNVYQGIQNSSNNNNSYVRIDDILEVVRGLRINNGGLTIKGVITSASAVPVTINDNLKVNRDIQVEGGISNPTIVNVPGVGPVGQLLKLNDAQGVEVTGSLITDGEMFVNGGLIINDGLGVMNGDVNIAGKYYGALDIERRIQPINRTGTGLQSVVAACPAGKVAISCGMSLNNSNLQFLTYSSTFPLGNCLGTFYIDSPVNKTIRGSLVAYCAEI